MKYEIANRNVGIDLLRGMSIVYIVGFWHMLNYSHAIPNYNNIVSYRITWIILATFVFTSGYFIGKNSNETKRQRLISFYIKLLLRIYPLYLLSIVIFTYLGILDFRTSIKASLMVSMFFKPVPPTLWFITMLMVFYALSPFLISACKNMKIIKMIVIYVFLSFSLMIYSYFTRLLDVRIIMYLPAFAFGIFVAINDQRVLEKKYLCIALCFGILISFLSNTPFIAANWLLATLMVTIAPYFLFAAFRKISFRNPKISHLIVLLSYSSYCMYLFHRPIYISFKNIFFPESDCLQLFYLVAFCLPCIGLFSYSIQKVYDKTNQVLRNKFS